MRRFLNLNRCYVLKPDVKSDPSKPPKPPNPFCTKLPKLFCKSMEFWKSMEFRKSMKVLFWKSVEYWKWLLGSGAGIIGIGVYYTTTEYYRVKTFRKGILNSTLTLKETVYFVDRPDMVKDIQDSVVKYGLKRTKLVVGNRGVGKSTIVRKAFEKQKGVVEISGGEDRKVANVASNLISKFVGSTQGYEDKVGALQHLLTECKFKSEVPIIIIEVDDKWTVENLRHLLVVAKRLGADNDLAHFFVVVSAAVGSFYTEIPFRDLRCEFLTVEEATEDQARDYFTKYFEKGDKKVGFLNFVMKYFFVEKEDKNDEKNEKNPLIEQAVRDGFQNFARMQALTLELGKHSSDESKEQCLTVEGKELYQDCKYASLLLLDNINIDRESKGFDLIMRITGGEGLHPQEFCRLSGIKQDELHKAMYNHFPHPFKVEMPECVLLPSSKFMAKVLTDVLKARA